MAVAPGAVIAPSGSRPEGPPFSAWVFIGFISLVAHLLSAPLLALVLLPFALAFCKMDAYRFLLMLVGCFALFFEPFSAGAKFHSFVVTDALVGTFVLLWGLSTWKAGTSIRLPVNAPLMATYSLVLYALALGVKSCLNGHYPLDIVFYDLKNYLYLLLAPALLVLDGYDREPKKVYLLLLAFILFTALYSIYGIGFFALTHKRFVTWNEIYISDGVITSALLLQLDLSKKTRRFLQISLPLCVLALVITQTRGLWLSTMVCMVPYYGRRVLRRGGVVSLVRNLLGLALVGGAIQFLCLLVFRISLFDLIYHRAVSSEAGEELVSPFSSIGYRIHESWAIWDQRTFFGHGAGAPIHLYFTQFNGKGKFMDWWSIHSGYFDMLHKYGFAGLGVLFWMFGSLYRQGSRFARMKARANSVFGSILKLVVVNHLVVSITAGFLIQANSVVLWMLFLYAVMKMERRAPLPA